MKEPLGECFPWAWKKILEITDAQARLVHAHVTFPWPVGAGRTFPHAWVEWSGEVYDWQTVVVREATILTVHGFYENWKPTQIQRYDVNQALAMYKRFRHTGPWLLRDAPGRIKRKQIPFETRA